MTFGPMIRELRRARELTQREVAAQAGVNFTYISKMENDRLERTPSSGLIRRLATILETDPDALLIAAGKFEPRSLQSLIAEIPEVAILLRRLQSRYYSAAQIRQILDMPDGHDPQEL